MGISSFLASYLPVANAAFLGLLSPSCDELLGSLCLS